MKPLKPLKPLRLQTAVRRYVAFRRSLGERCVTNGNVLASFSRAMGRGVTLAQVRPGRVAAFLAGSGPLTASWHVRHNALLGFYRHALSRGYASRSPLPATVPKRPPAFVPYVYSLEELRRLVDGTGTYQRHRSRFDPRAFRAILLVMYGAALRAGEAIGLTVADVDLAAAVLRVRDAKFFKTRLVPVGPRLAEALREYGGHAGRQAAGGRARDGGEPFFVGRTGAAVNLATLEGAFRRLCRHAGIRRPGGPRCQPRLHDLRHTSAVHRVTAWYRQGADVQKLLPQLSVYMGHAHLAATQTYLSMTPELLQEAGSRFQAYASRGESHESHE